MKKLLLLFILLPFLLSTATACDVCGGTLNSGFTSVIPMFSKNKISLNHQLSIFEFANYDVSQEVAEVNKDFITRSTLSFRKYVNKRMFVTTDLPFVFNKRFTDKDNIEVKGIGNIQFGLQYLLLDIKDSSKKYKHIFVGGLSTSIPSGKYQQRDSRKAMLPIGLQVGNGAWTNTATLQYSISGAKWGLSAISQASLSTENEMFYKMGNQFNEQLIAFYRITGFASMWMPSLGFSYIHKDNDLEFSKVHESTSYSSAAIQTGLDVFFDKWWFSAKYSKPLLEEKTIIQPQNMANIQLGIHYFIKQKDTD